MEIQAADDGLTSDLRDLDDTPLDAIAETLAEAGDPTETVRRVAPSDGTRLLVAASFNSAI